VPLGLRVATADVSKKMGLRVPDDGEDVLQVGQTNAPATPPTNPQTASAQPCPSCGEVHRASAQDDDDLVNEALANWEADVGPTVGLVLAAAKGSASYEEFLAELDKIEPNMGAMGDRLAIAMMKARGDGDTDG